MVNPDRRRMGTGSGARCYGLLVSALLLVALWAPRVALGDCCNCTFDLGPPTGVVPFCEGNDLTSCPVTSIAFNCEALIAGGTCSPSNNAVNSVCNPPAPTSTPTATSTAT